MTMAMTMPMTMAMAMTMATAHAYSARFKEMIQDITDGYDWVWTHLAQHVGAKSVRGVAVEGWSAGAHLACLVVSCDCCDCCDCRLEIPLPVEPRALSSQIPVLSSQVSVLSVSGRRLDRVLVSWRNLEPS
jgi:hypothetical protein